MFRKISFSLIYTTLIVLVVYPFLRYNNLDIWDTSGHYQAIWFVKNYLLPQHTYTGWNPFAFAGFPQGLLYPPLFHFVGAMLAAFTNIDLALKLLVVAPILLFPVVIYFFCKVYTALSKDELTILVIFYTFALFLFGNMVGGSIGSTFNSGMVVNNLALVLFFLFLTVIKLRKFFLSVFLLALIILTHLPTTVAALIALVALALYNRSNIKWYSAVAITTFCLTCFWTIPLLVFSSESAFDFLGAVKVITIIEVLAFIFFLYYAGKEYRPKFNEIASICFLISLVCLVSLIAKFPTWHVYRIMNYAYWLLPLLMFFGLKILGVITDKKLLALLTAAFIFYASSSGISVISNTPFKVALPSVSSENRIIVNYNIPAPINMPHYLNDQIPIVSGNTPVLGLFLEESTNSFYLMQYVYRLSNRNFVWGINPAEFMKFAGQKLDEEKIAQLYNIHYILETDHFSDVTEGIIGEIPNSGGSFNDTSSALVLKELPNSGHLVEPLTDFTLYKATDAKMWKERVNSWFFTYPLPKELIINSDNRQLISSPKSYEITDIKYTSDMSAISFYSRAESPSWILIKVSYFPKWHAFMNNEKIPVYRVSPNLMAVYGTGQISMRYYDFQWENALRVFSASSLGVVFVLTLAKSRKLALTIRKLRGIKTE